MMMDWFRSHHGAPTDPKWRTIAKRAGVAPGVVVSIAWALLDAASQAPDRGSVASVDAETLADFMGYEVDVVERVVAAMVDKGVLAGERFTAWERRQPKREDDGAADRKRQQRERERLAREDAARQAVLPLVPPSHEASHDVTTEQSRAEQIRAEAGKPACAQTREPAASPPLSDDLEFKHAATEALGGGKVKGRFGVLASVAGDRERIVDLLRRESATRANPIGSWELAATVATEKLAETPKPPPAARGSPLPAPDDSPKVNTPSGPRSVAFLRREHAAGRWSTLYGPPPGKLGCLLPAEPALEAAE